MQCVCGVGGREGGREENMKTVKEKCERLHRNGKRRVGHCGLDDWSTPPRRMRQMVFIDYSLHAMDVTVTAHSSALFCSLPRCTWEHRRVFACACTGLGGGYDIEL